MKNKKINNSIYVSCTTLFFFLLSFAVAAQSDIEIEDGKLKVYRINANAEVEVATSGANANAWIQFGDDSTANEATLGWHGTDEMFKLALSGTLNNNGLTIKEVGTASRFGFGALPDDDAKLFVNHNSLAGATPSPHLLLRENNSTGLARLQFGQFSVDSYWQVAAKSNTDAVMNFYHHDGTDGENIFTLDGDDGSAAINDGKLMVNKTNSNAIVEIATTSNTNDAVIEFGDSGNANDAILGYDGSDNTFKISLGTQLDNGGITMENLNSADRIGVGTSPDANAKMIISHNSSAGQPSDPHLRLQENSNTDFSRLEFGNFGVSEYWHISADATPGDPKMHFFYRDASSGDNILTIDGDAGTVGIQRTATANALEVNGDASKTTAGDWGSNSDRRIKTDIREIDDSWSTLLALRPVKFKYTSEWKKRNPEIADKYYYNFIAQEYAKVFPESAKGSGEYLEGDTDEILQIDTYNAQIVHMVATQELIKENQRLKEELNTLQERMTAFSAELAKMQVESVAVSNRDED